ncbi:A disintegrin and metalloproteinase with thrombospondin motifs 7 [Clarias gariepinus]|uniref:A disintegrin and metalloproteinase with thrombospondin motifs 7 n=1 Tax=Clarias gariepinus TaxID=13013 RepID=UPI00234DC876|nr:A disintegrin and metalloproteinase with thrombospondin motifs 7 [Clarias gariepinus]
MHPKRGFCAFGSAFWLPAVLLTLVESADPNVLNEMTGGSREGLLQYEIVHPQRVDPDGVFISNLVSYRVSRVRRRQTVDGTDSGLPHVFYYLQYNGEDLLFNLTLNPHLLAPGFLTEWRYGGLRGSRLHSLGNSLCYFLGEVWSDSAAKGQAAVSTCDGLTGLFKLSEEEFFIRPLEQTHGSEEPQAHVIYKRHTSEHNSQLVQPLFEGKTSNGTCGVKDVQERAQREERQRERWERRHHRRRRRSISREKWVETLVVADPKMVEYHGKNGVETYVLAVMNVVAGLFRDPSIGNTINIAVVRLILLEQDEEDLKITHHADNSLNSFCKWQKHLNIKGDEHPVHHDVAVLLTRKDICASINKPCETLGLSHVAGMCQPHRSCSINEDTGLPLAFTVAHELGHNFGIEHDGNGNNCEPIGKRPFVMSPQLLYGTSPPNWSRCSRQYITRFLDRGWGWCLDDPPGRNELAAQPVLPGVLYSAAHQCRLQYGSGSQLCDDMDNVCSTLWCTVASTCHSKLDGAVDGTDCGDGKWCLNGECVSAASQPEKVNGGWGPWSEWSSCTRTCGAGVQDSHRDCVNPIPKNGGKYCLGERRRYKICNHKPCAQGQPSFRAIQCSKFNNLPYKSKFYQWIHVNNRINPCELHCRPVNEYFSDKMVDAVIDGTRCYEGSQSRDMCINGICKSIGCDYEIDSNAVEDHCGVCHGNGSTCETVKKTFEKSEGLGYVDIGLIPEGARDIRIEEVAEAGNFLALRSNNPEKYFLNGDWTIQWTGEFKAAGTVFTYERTGQLENLTSPGPTMEPVWIQLLFQETNPGVRYQYTINREVLTPESSSGNSVSDFQWKRGAWTECSATCGTGVKRQVVHCVERTFGIVEEHYCDASTRPDDNRVSCNAGLCPATWWTGEWQKCSTSCGVSGLTKRTVVCIRSLGLEKHEALLPSECQHLSRPESISHCNRHISCPADWTTGNWSECSISCSGGVQTREVTCSWNTMVDCDPQTKPDSVKSCNVQDCPKNMDSDWSGSGSSSREVFNEINAIVEDSHLLKSAKGATRGQPREGNTLNSINDDFSYHNEIEADKAIKSNVLVDDFYYDYNFIKFHEELSYDFDNDGASDNSGTHLKQEPKPGLDPVYREEAKPSTATSFASHTTVPPTASTTESSRFDQPDESASEDDSDFSEDYFLPVGTTARPRSPITRFSQKWKEVNVPTQDFDTKQSMLPNYEIPSDGKPTLDDAISNINTRSESGNDYNREIQTDDDAPKTPGSQKENKGQEGTNQQEESLQQNLHDYEDTYELNMFPLSTTMDPLTSQLNADIATKAATPMETLSNLELRRITTPSPLPAWMDNDYDKFITPLFPSFEEYTSSVSLASSVPSQGSNSQPQANSEPFTGFLLPSASTSFWITSNWSSCSTSCGLGAIWRSVHCSTGNDSDCDMVKRPLPARRCHIRPCAIWKAGEWSKCSKNCGGGLKVREIQCYNMRDQRPLRPFHCQAMSLRPHTHMSCNLQLCLDWSTAPWGQCSEPCGEGEQQRMIACPVEGKCDEAQKPASIQQCNSQPCAQWVTGSWGQCSVSCGGGVQHRLVKCVNTKAELEEEDEKDKEAQCDHEPWPENTRQCNLEDCDSATSGEECLRDRLTFPFCQKLQWLGRCHQLAVRSQCCKTCEREGRGNERATRR